MWKEVGFNRELRENEISFFWKDNLNLFTLDNCGDLNKNDPHWLIGLNTWSLGVALLGMD